MSRTLHFALAPLGVGGPGSDGLWKDARVAKNSSVDIGYYIDLAKLAERGLFDAFFVVDSQFVNADYPAHYLNRLEPLTLLSAVATHTENIGLVATASSTYNSPSPRAPTRTERRWKGPRPSTRTSSPAPPPLAATPITS